MSELALPDKVRALHTALEDDAVPHAFGGAIALAYYAEPRATIDIDLNVFVGAEHIESIVTVLSGLGVDQVGGLRASRVSNDAQARVRWGRTPIDLFFACHPIHESMATSVRSVPFGSAHIPVLGPEHLVVCKVVFDRAKDWIDIAQALALTPGFDPPEVRRWLGEVLPEGDRRVARFDSLVAQILG